MKKNIKMKKTKIKKYKNNAEINVTRHFFKAGGPQGRFSKKQKKLDMLQRSVCTKFEVCIVFPLIRG